MRKLKTTVLILAAVALLAFVFWWGGNAPGLKGIEFYKESEEAEIPEAEKIPEITVTEDILMDEAIEESTESEAIKEIEIREEIKSETESEAVYIEEAAPEAAEGNEETRMICTISVRCDTIFANANLIEPSLLEALPADGIILAPFSLEFTEGESAFDILERTLRNKNIHMEFTNTPMYKSAYIEGIANLYEFDCGELSGWMYRVNGTFPDYGSSLYEVKNGDIIEWLYTCDRGKDVGGKVE